jgi:hypothetical protein
MDADDEPAVTFESDDEVEKYVSREVRTDERDVDLRRRAAPLAGKGGGVAISRIGAVRGVATRVSSVASVPKPVREPLSLEPGSGWARSIEWLPETVVR